MSVDVVEVTIGDRTQIGPGVQILAADIRATQRGGPLAWSLAARFASGATSGSEQERSSCRAFRSVMVR
jgi:hypothetical protein